MLRLQHLPTNKQSTRFRKLVFNDHCIASFRELSLYYLPWNCWSEPGVWWGCWCRSWCWGWAGPWWRGGGWCSQSRAGDWTSGHTPGSKEILTMWHCNTLFCGTVFFYTPLWKNDILAVGWRLEETNFHVFTHNKVFLLNVRNWKRISEYEGWVHFLKNLWSFTSSLTKYFSSVFVL